MKGISAKMQRPQTEAQQLFLNTKQITPPKIPKTPKINWDIFCSEFTHNLSAKKLEKHWKVQMPGKRREESGERGGGEWQWHLTVLSVWPRLDSDSSCCTPATNFSFYYFLSCRQWCDQCCRLLEQCFAKIVKAKCYMRSPHWWQQ